MFNRIRDFFIWLGLWLEEPAKYTRADEIAIPMLILSNVLLLHFIVTLLLKFYF